MKIARFLLRTRGELVPKLLTSDKTEHYQQSIRLHFTLQAVLTISKRYYTSTKEKLVVLTLLGQQMLFNGLVEDVVVSPIDAVQDSVRRGCFSGLLGTAG